MLSAFCAPSLPRRNTGTTVERYLSTSGPWFDSGEYYLFCLCYSMVLPESRIAHNQTGQGDTQKAHLYINSIAERCPVRIRNAGSSDYLQESLFPVILPEDPVRNDPGSKNSISTG